MVGRDGDDEPLLTLIHNLNTLREGVPIYFIAGDEDPEPVLSTARGTPKVLASWVEDAQKAGAIYLDAPVSQTVGKKTVWFSPEYLYDVDVDGLIGALTSQQQSMEAQGTQYEAEGGAAYRALGYRIEAYQRTQQALKEMTDTDLQIAVNHVPMETSLYPGKYRMGRPGKNLQFSEYFAAAVRPLLRRPVAAARRRGHLCARKGLVPLGRRYSRDAADQQPESVYFSGHRGQR